MVTRECGFLTLLELFPGFSGFSGCKAGDTSLVFPLTLHDSRFQQFCPHPSPISILRCEWLIICVRLRMRSGFSLIFPRLPESVPRIRYQGPRLLRPALKCEDSSKSPWRWLFADADQLIDGFLFPRLWFGTAPGTPL